MGGSCDLDGSPASRQEPSRLSTSFPQDSATAVVFASTTSQVYSLTGLFNNVFICSCAQPQSGHSLLRTHSSEVVCLQQRLLRFGDDAFAWHHWREAHIQAPQRGTHARVQQHRL